MREGQAQEIARDIISLSASLTEPNYRVSPEEILHCLVGMLVDEEDAGRVELEIKKPYKF